MGSDSLIKKYTNKISIPLQYVQWVQKVQKVQLAPKMKIKSTDFGM